MHGFCFDGIVRVTNSPDFPGYVLFSRPFLAVLLVFV